MKCTVLQVNQIKIAKKPKNSKKYIDKTAAGVLQYYSQRKKPGGRFRFRSGMRMNLS